MKRGWRTVQLGDICSFYRGLTYSKTDEVEYSNTVVLRSNNIDLATFTLNFDELKYLRDDLLVLEEKKVQKGSLLICMANGSKEHLGKVALVEEEMNYAFGGFMGLLRPNLGDIEPKYLYYYLVSEKYRKFISSLSDGANINNLKYNDLKSFEIVLPSLLEQKRIIEKLDNAFAKIDSKRKTSVIQLESTSILEEKLLNKLFSSMTICKKCMLKEISLFKNGLNYTKVKDGFNYRFLGVGDFKNNNMVETETLDIIHLKEELDDDYLLKNNDIVFVRSNGSKTLVGRNVLVKLGEEQSTFSGFCIRCRLIDSTVVPQYVNLYCSTQLFKKQLNLSGNGCNISNINQTVLGNSFIPIPSLEKQQNILSRAQDLLNRINTLKNCYRQEISECDSLRKSILQQTFKG